MKIRQVLQCELARREFWEYCKLKAPDFYREDRPFLRELCETMQNFYFGDNDSEILSINIAPRHGKSRTATLFVEWVLGKDNKTKIMTGSYNETLSTEFSKQVRNAIQEEKADDDKLVYSDIFPNTKIKDGDAQASMWSLEGSSVKNYLATSPNGTATGFGCNLMIIDDLIKNAEEAKNQNALEKQWSWFTNTMLSRREGKKKIIIIMTRWATKDLAGRALEHFENIGAKVSALIFPTEQKDGSVLCDSILDKATCEVLKMTLGEDIFQANYNQQPIDLKGVLYTYLETYDELPEEILTIDNYTDTADTGEDYLCSITYAIGAKTEKAYILDIIYTQEDMTVTEPLLARTLMAFDVNVARVESNNGGRGFSRNVERETRKLGNNKTMFKPFTQTKNKVTRILTGATGVMLNVLFPKDWATRFPEFYRDTIQYQRIGKNIHDDNVDTLTGVYEKMTYVLNKGAKPKKKKYANFGF